MVSFSAPRTLRRGLGTGNLPFMQLLQLWLGIYVLALGAIGWGLRPWYRRRWFKLVCLPGTLLGALLQATGALLCVHPVKKIHGFKDGEPFVELGLSRLPTLGAALFVVVTQAAFFALFLTATGLLESAGVIQGRGIALPTAGPDIGVKELGASTRAYLDAALGWTAQAPHHPVAVVLLLYVYGSTCAALRLCRRQWQSALLGLGALAALSYAATWFGVGVRTFSRAWWIEWLYVPEWWERFSLFLTLGFVALGGITALRTARAVGHRLARLTARSPSHQFRGETS